MFDRMLQRYFHTDLPFPINLLWYIIIGFFLMWYIVMGIAALVLILIGLAIGHFFGWTAFGIYIGALALIAVFFWVKEKLTAKKQTS